MNWNFALVEAADLTVFSCGRSLAVGEETILGLAVKLDRIDVDNHCLLAIIEAEDPREAIEMNSLISSVVDSFSLISNFALVLSCSVDKQ